MTEKIPKRSRTFADSMRESARGSDDGLIWSGGVLGTPEERARERDIPPEPEPDTRTIITSTLDRIYKDRGGSASAMGLLLVAPWFLLIFLYISNLIEQPLFERMLLFCYISSAVLMAAIFTLILQQYLYTRSLQWKIRQYADPAALVPGPANDFSYISNYVPRLFRKSFPEPDSSLAVNEQAYLVAHNLDWFLDEPKRLLRVSWFSRIISIVIIGALAYCFVDFDYLLHDDAEGVVTGSAFMFGWIAFAAVRSIVTSLAQHNEAIRVEVYRDFVLDWYRTHSPEDAGD